MLASNETRLSKNDNLANSNMSHGCHDYHAYGFTDGTSIFRTPSCNFFENTFECDDEDFILNKRD